MLATISVDFPTDQDTSVKPSTGRAVKFGRVDLTLLRSPLTALTPLGWPILVLDRRGAVLWATGNTRYALEALGARRTRFRQFRIGAQWNACLWALTSPPCTTDYQLSVVDRPPTDVLALVATGRQWRDRLIVCVGPPCSRFPTAPVDPLWDEILTALRAVRRNAFPPADMQVA
jgi:hypothetical protein